MGPKCGRTQPFLTGSHFGGIKLKDRSAGGWRSGLQRSEMSWRRGHVCLRACRLALQHLPCQAIVDFGIRISDWPSRANRLPEIRNRKSAFRNLHSRLPAHGDLSLEGHGFLVIGIDGDGTGRVLPRFVQISSFQKNTTQEDVGVDQRMSGFPKNRSLQ